MNIQFIRNGSFVGETYEMVVDGKTFYFGITEEIDAKKSAIKILKETYNNDFDIHQIVFKWGGKM